jgi:hypothetical protein
MEQNFRSTNQGATQLKKQYDNQIINRIIKADPKFAEKAWMTLASGKSRVMIASLRKAQKQLVRCIVRILTTMPRSEDSPDNKASISAFVGAERSTTAKLQIRVKI